MAKRNPAIAPVESLLVCPQCKREMRLFGIEPEDAQRDLFTFECESCKKIEVRGVRVT